MVALIKTITRIKPEYYVKINFSILHEKMKITFNEMVSEEVKLQLKQHLLLNYF